MPNSDLHIFILLKKAIESTFLKENDASFSIKDWKGQEIIDFQEDLFNKVKATISEKWFYTYLKKDAKNLPRIDMLNFLSAYVGFKNWNAFKIKHKRKTSKKQNLLKIIIGFLFLVFVLFYYNYNRTNKFHFCFFDEDKNEIIKTKLSIKIISKSESLIFLKTDSLGCFNYATSKKSIKFVVASPFYKTDTIIRFINSKTNNRIDLQTDDYTLMLQYYSNGNTKDWKKRKQHLNELISDKAQIYQFFKNSIAIELYSKNDFIHKMTTPTRSLKNIEILDKTFKNGKIIKLKFIVE